jgi:hypothetical protein
MIWLVSYPRSGNTFFRNILFHVYGLNSKAFYLENEKLCRVDQSVTVTKTHHLPEDTPIGPEDTVVYLVRDGRDAIVSMANQVTNITKVGSGFRENIYAILFGRGKEFFGGWSRHVTEWRGSADVVIKFEDLVSDPLQEVEKLRNFMTLPDPDVSQMPTFESQKSGQAEYKGRDSNLFFHKGQVGGWKNALSKAQLNLCYRIHGEELRRSGYEHSPVYTSQNPIFECIYLFRKLRGMIHRFWEMVFHPFKGKA